MTAPERAAGATKGDIDLRILTPGLSEEEIAAVTSVVAAAVEAQRPTGAGAGEPPATVNERRWRRSLGPLAGASGFDSAR